MEHRRRHVLGKGARYVLIGLGAVAMSLPFLWMLSTSFKLPVDVFTRELRLWPSAWTLDNFVRAWNMVPFGRFMWNSFFVAAVVTFSQVLTAALAGYAFGRLRFPGRDLIFAVYLGTMMIPNQVTLIPAYLILRVFGMLDTYYALTVPFLAHPFGAFLMRQFFMSLPASLEDAARIDGCSRLGVLFRILLPVSKPALAATSMFVFLFSWNDFLWPLIVTNSESMRTIQVGLAYFRTDMGTDWTALMAASTIATIPIVILFFLGQRHFVEGIASSGVKY